MELFWLQDFVDDWRRRVRAKRVPHAVLLTGPGGVGKRCAAAWIAATRVGRASLDSLPAFPPAILEHADVFWVRKATERQSILIEQIRALTAALALTSYEGRGQTAVIEPADTMNAAAANSLLKTLEEPAGDALLVLVVDRMGKLPATVVSRCQRIGFNAPGERQALAWLAGIDPGRDWRPALRSGGDAPLTALLAAERESLHEQLQADFKAVAAQTSSPLDVAARWSKEDPERVLEWLSRQLTLAVKDTMAAPQGHSDRAIDRSVLQRIDSRNLFCYLDIINRLRARPAGAFNAQSAFEGLLIDWSAGLRTGDTYSGLEAVYAAGSGRR